MTPFSLILKSNDPGASWRFAAGEMTITLAYANGEAVAKDRHGNILLRTADPFVAFAWMEASDLSTMPDARWVGYISYEFARHIERLPATTIDDLGIPLFHFTLCQRDVETTFHIIRYNPDANESFRSRSMTRDHFESAVRRALDYIAAGDIFQVNMAQRLSFTGDSARRTWDRLSPSQYGALLQFDDLAIVSNSPELFFRIEPQPDGSRKIINRPIKGTRPNAPGMFDELSHSAKDRAELAMIVDLQRNDLGRVCEIGSVVVTEPRVIEATPTVYHGVATIEGSLRRDASFADVIRALFPCGSITGCPKIRAMEIIDELEPVARGPYCGAIGYLAADGSAEFNVAIRTMVIKDGLAHVYVGGGIVADSSPEAEYDETLVKAKAMLAALGVEDLPS